MSHRFDQQANVGQWSAKVGSGLRVGLAMTLVAVAALTMSRVANAQAEGGADPDGYGYEFEDDPLNAGGFGPNDATIRVRPKAARTTLIRPRTTFVPEMLKSVENL
jgi:hypothetical protein